MGLPIVRKWRSAATRCRTTMVERDVTGCDQSYRGGVVPGSSSEIKQKFKDSSNEHSSKSSRTNYMGESGACCLESVPDESIEPLASVWVPKVDATLSVGNMWSNSRGSKRGSHQTFVLRALVPGVRRYIHYIIYRKWSSRGRSTSTYTFTCWKETNPSGQNGTYSFAFHMWWKVRVCTLRDIEWVTRQIGCAYSCSKISGVSDQVDCRTKMRIVTEGVDYDGSTQQSTYVYSASPNACAAV